MWQLKNNKIVLVKVSMEYTNFLRDTIDYKVPREHIDNDSQARPFIGILIANNQHQFVIPISSPKSKHIRMQNTIDFHKIDGGKYGAINFNNMFPIIEDDNVCKIIDAQINKDCPKSELQYRNLVRNQLTWLNLRQNKTIVLQKAEKLYNSYVSGKLDKKVRARCCDFIKLQEQYINYQNPKDKI